MWLSSKWIWYPMTPERYFFDYLWNYSRQREAWTTQLPKQTQSKKIHQGSNESVYKSGCTHLTFGVTTKRNTRRLHTWKILQVTFKKTRFLLHNLKWKLQVKKETTNQNFIFCRSILCELFVCHGNDIFKCQRLQPHWAVCGQCTTKLPKAKRGISWKIMLTF